MKVTHINNTEFKPIELKITIETENELRSLWHRLNIGWKYIPPACTSANLRCPFPTETGSNTYALWRTLDDIIL